ncbi:glycerophosphodiester phosphodiesterase family protein [Terrimonas sp. NA20]|uniref:Glycerophosphodiester phosphodiesterase family protein n=1 Tax=Terrimonas ginsenosidimutans TaxID=2908004 RepID=A0ABS9KN65_9BACT|nr:glycerophosphodiester phosphodiesterase family protein [Terrimonas ginsenosidimutans]MCG2613751.1 glycerophosphodiester phosphodiesterase family protein [Terrimonas ginsenosidimutans]
MKQILFAAGLLISVFVSAQSGRQRTAAGILQQFLHPSSKTVLVAAHRGDWRNAPENSIHALRLSLQMGVDIMETDVRMTKDGVLVLMHDETINRTTSGKGKVNELTWDSLQRLTLRQAHGGTTEERIPSFEEFMDSVKGKPILINLDKCWDFIPEVYRVLKKTGTLEHGLFKGNLPLPELRAKFGTIVDSIHYMPIVANNHPDALVNGYLNDHKTAGFELCFNTMGSTVLSQTLPLVRKHGVTVWLNSLWPSLCAGRDDEKAMVNPDANWGWLIQIGANVIQTDRPKELLEYLRKKKLHI